MAVAPPGPVLELCCGAAQIGLLAVRGNDRPLICVDADPVAVSFARQNARSNGLESRVEVREGTFTQALSPGELFPVIIADPPWVPTAEIARFPDDPRSAIDGGADGLGTARSCIAAVASHLPPGGVALVQLGSVQQAHSLRRFVQASNLVFGEVREYGDKGVVLFLEQDA